MLHHPTFSIITVTYNAGAMLEDTIRSVVAQTYAHVEYLIIDGNSTDGTHQIVENYRSQINTFICERDNGLYDAMNKGIKAAKGDYLCFLNAGDTFHKSDTLQKMVDSIHGDELPDILYGDTQLVDSNRRFVRMRRLSPPAHLNWKSFKQGMLVCHQAFFAKRALAEPYNLSYRFSADFDWCIRIMKKAHTLHHTHQIIIDYLEEGMTTQNHNASLKERFCIMAKYYGLCSTILEHVWFFLRAAIKK